MNAIQILFAGMWIIIMWVISSGNNLSLFLTFGTAMVFALIACVGSGDEEPVKAKKIKIQYKKGKGEVVVGTEWSRYDDVLSIYNNELEDNLVKEISLDIVKSVEFVNVGEGEQ